MQADASSVKLRPEELQCYALRSGSGLNHARRAHLCACRGAVLGRSKFLHKPSRLPLSQRPPFHRLAGNGRHPRRRRSLLLLRAAAAGHGRCRRRRRRMQRRRVADSALARCFQRRYAGRFSSRADAGSQAHFDDGFRVPRVVAQLIACETPFVPQVNDMLVDS